MKVRRVVLIGPVVDGNPPGHTILIPGVDAPPEGVFPIVSDEFPELNGFYEVVPEDPPTAQGDSNGI